MGKFNRSSQHKQSAEWRNRGFKSSGNISQFDADSAESANHVEPVAGAKKIMKTKPKVLAKKNVLKGKIGHEVTAKKVKNKLPAPTEKMEEAAISETGAGSSVGEKELQKKTKVKTEGSATIAEEEAGDVVEGVDKVPGKRKKQKFKSYNLFVGNLSFDTTSEDIIKHFAKAGVPKSVRIPLKKEDNSPRGIAYIEFEDSVAYEVIPMTCTVPSLFKLFIIL